MAWNINIFNITNNIILAIVILFVGLIIGRIFGRVLLKIFQEAELNSWARKIHIKFSLEDLLAKSTEIVIYVITVLLTLNQIGIAKFFIIALLAFISLIIIVSIILGIRDFIPNYFAGLKIKKRFNIGYHLKLGHVKGRIEKINLVETRIRTQKGDIFLVPHSYTIHFY